MSYHLRRYKNSPYWYARITLPNGTRGNWKSTRKARKHDARAVAEQWDAAATSNHRVVTVDEAFRYLAEHMERKGDSDATMDILSLKASHVWTFLGKQRDIATLELQDTEAYLDMRRLPGKNGRPGVGDSTIAKELGYLIGALHRCRTLKLYFSPPEALWPSCLPKSFPGRKRWLPWEEYLLVLEHIISQWRDHLIVYTSTGVRFDELYQLRAHGVRRGWLVIDGSKTEGAERKIPISVEATEALQRRVALSADGILFPMTSPNMGSQKRAWLRALGKACLRAKIAHASTNDLRRTFCSWAWHHGVDERVVVGWMGHRSSKMVREVYAQPSREQGAREVAKMPTRHALPLTPMSPQTQPFGAN